MPVTEATEVKTARTTDSIVLAAGVGMAAVGLYLGLKKPPTVDVYPGDKVTVGSASFKYLGVEADLFLCWGLRKGTGDFNNGENLLGGLWVWGGPIHVLEALDWKTYNISPQKLETKPIFYLDPDIVAPGDYQTYAWITKDEPFVDRDKEFLTIILTGQKPFSWEGWIRVKNPE